MLITEENTPQTYQIQGYQPGAIIINQQTYHHSLIISKDQLISDWAPQSLDDLQALHFAAIIELQPEVVILGTGRHFHHLKGSLLQPLYEQQIGVESMDTGAACRTYIALLAEQRNVVAALLID